MVRLTRKGITPGINLVDTADARAAIEAKYPFLADEPWRPLNNGGFAKGEAGLAGRYGYQFNFPETAQAPIMYLAEVYPYISDPPSDRGKYFGGVVLYRLTETGELRGDGPTVGDELYGNSVHELMSVLDSCYKGPGEVNWVQLVGQSFEQAKEARDEEVQNRENGS